VLEPAGIDWALRQPMEFQVMKDAIHLTEEGYRAWARAMLRPHNFTKSS
jgi:lysophospholipase L1-like esterase